MFLVVFISFAEVLLVILQNVLYKFLFCIKQTNCSLASFFVGEARFVDDLT